MIAIIPILYLQEHFLRTTLIFLGHTTDVLGKDRLHFLFGNAADGREVGAQGEVFQVVDGGEDTQLGEFCDARNEAELDVGVAGLERHIELLHHLAESRQVLLFVKHFEQRCIVFVDDDSDLKARFLISAMNHASQSFARRLF